MRFRAEKTRAQLIQVLGFAPDVGEKTGQPAPGGIALTTTADPVFTNLGAAAPAATVTVTHGSTSLSVIVSASGRVIVGR